MYRDEGTFVDAHWFKVSVFRDRDSLGTALGIVDGLSSDNELPEGEAGVDLLFRMRRFAFSVGSSDP
jgi:hypothetical protein